MERLLTQFHADIEAARKEEGFTPETFIPKWVKENRMKLMNNLDFRIVFTDSGQTALIQGAIDPKQPEQIKSAIKSLRELLPEKETKTEQL